MLRVQAFDTLIYEHLFCTPIEYMHGLLTNLFASKACHGQDKHSPVQ